MSDNGCWGRKIVVSLPPDVGFACDNELMLGHAYVVLKDDVARKLVALVGVDQWVIVRVRWHERDNLDAYCWPEREVSVVMDARPVQERTSYIHTVVDTGLRLVYVEMFLMLRREIRQLWSRFWRRLGGKG